MSNRSRNHSRNHSRNRPAKPAEQLLLAALILLTSALSLPGADAAQKPIRGQDQVDAPAVDEGLCVHNLFQSNMVLQRDKPTPIWGWAAAGEAVTVSFAGQTHRTKAKDDRSQNAIEDSRESPTPGS